MVLLIGKCKNGFKVGVFFVVLWVVRFSDFYGFSGEGGFFVFFSIIGVVF